MYDDDKSMDVHLICNQRVVTYNKFQGIKPMGVSSLGPTLLILLLYSQ